MKIILRENGFVIKEATEADKKKRRNFNYGWSELPNYAVYKEKEYEYSLADCETYEEALKALDLESRKKNLNIYRKFKSAKDFDYSLDELIEILKDQYQELIDSMKINSWFDYSDFNKVEYRILTVVFDIGEYSKENTAIIMYKENPTDKKLHLQNFYLTNSVEKRII